MRALAVGAVVAYHLGYLRGGYLGVDAFFVVSGFLITRLLVAEWQDRGGIGLRRFWARRARRLAPALLALLGAVTVLTPWLSPDSVAATRSDGFAALLYVGNWHAIAHGSYFSRLGAPSLLEHLWSLAVEEQFYLVWPLLLLALLWLLRGSLRKVLAVTAGLAAASYAWMFVAFSPSQDPTRVYEGTDTRAGALLLGAALALWLATRAAGEAGAVGEAGAAGAAGGRGPVSRLVPGAVLAGGVAWLAAMWWHLSGTSPSLYRGALAGCGVAAAVVVLACASGGRLAGWLGVRPLRAVGERSYAIYLWHWPLFVWLGQRRTGLSGLPLTAVRVAAVLAAACLSYSFVERPVRRGWLPKWQGVVALPVAAASVAVLLVATSAPAVASYGEVAGPPASGGVHLTLAADAGSAAASAGASAGDAGATVPSTTSSTSSTSTTAVPPPPPPPPLVINRRPTRGQPLRVYVLGDSLAWQATPALVAALDSTGMARVGSFAFVGEQLTDNQYNWQQKWPVVLNQEHPDVVVLSLGIWDRAYASHDPAGYTKLVDQAVGMILATGADLLWVEQPASGPPPERPGTVVFPTASEQSVDAVYEALPYRYPGRVAWVPTTPTFEPNGVYTAFLPGVSGRAERVHMPDNFHICPAGAVLLTELVINAMAPWGLPAPATSWVTTGGWWEGVRYSADAGGGGCARPDGAPPV